MRSAEEHPAPALSFTASSLLALTQDSVPTVLPPLSALERHLNARGPPQRLPGPSHCLQVQVQVPQLSLHLTSCSARLVSCCFSLVPNTQTPRSPPSPPSDSAFSCLRGGCLLPACLECSLWLSSHARALSAPFPAPSAVLAPLQSSEFRNHPQERCPWLLDGGNQGKFCWRSHSERVTKLTFKPTSFWL